MNSRALWLCIVSLLCHRSRGCQASFVPDAPFGYAESPPVFTAGRSRGKQIEMVRLGVGLSSVVPGLTRGPCFDGL
jgi:hypothetical protein